MKNIEEIKKTPNLFIEAETKNDGMGGKYYDKYTGKRLNFIFSYQMGWEHLSVSMPSRTPTWDQMCIMKDIFWNKNEACVGFLTADNLFEYVDPRINKGYGIEKVAKHFGVKLENCVAFGDEQNDKEMLEKVGMGVCMRNGSQDVKECSAFVSPYTNDESAVGRFIEENVFKEEMDVIL